jgi:hypothetical protein
MVIFPVALRNKIFQFILQADKFRSNSFTQGGRKKGRYSCQICTLLRAPYIFLILGVISIFGAIVSTCTGKTWAGTGRTISRAKEPSEFWWIVAIYYLGGRSLHWVFLVHGRVGWPLSDFSWRFNDENVLPILEFRVSKNCVARIAGNEPRVILGPKCRPH